MEIYRTGCTTAYDETDTPNISFECNKCGCDECNCYDKVREEVAYYGDGSTTESNP